MTTELNVYDNIAIHNTALTHIQTSATTKNLTTNHIKPDQPQSRDAEEQEFHMSASSCNQMSNRSQSYPLLLSSSEAVPASGFENWPFTGLAS